MKVLLYQPTSDSMGGLFEKTLTADLAFNDREIHRTVESLSARISQSRHDIAVAVLLAATSQDLADLHAIRDLLKNVRIVLVLPDSDKKTVARGHELRPRFLTYAQSDFSDVEAVVKKMLENIPSSSEVQYKGDDST